MIAHKEPISHQIRASAGESQQKITAKKHKRRLQSDSEESKGPQKKLDFGKNPATGDEKMKVDSEYQTCTFGKK